MGSVARCVVVLFWLALFFGAVASADDALVLPKGRIRVGLEHLFFLPTDERWGPRGKAEELAGAFDGRALDSSIFPTLTALNPLVPGGRASIGDSTVHFEYQYNILAVTAAYGITDRFTLGVDLPYYWVHNDVDVSVNTGPGSSANVGLRTGAGPGPCALPVAVLPLTCPNTRRFTTEDVQQILGPGLPGIAGFGFKRVKDFSADGLGDITLGLKYQYLRTEAWRLAATTGIRFPTGRRDDPDNLADIYWSTGAYALLVRLHHDYLLSHLWNTRTLAASGPQSLRPGDLLLNCTLRYDGSCTPTLRTILLTQKPGRMPPSQPVLEGARPWSHIFFSTNLPYSFSCGSSSCCTSRGPSQVCPPQPCQLNPSATAPASPNPLRG